MVPGVADSIVLRVSGTGPPMAYIAKTCGVGFRHLVHVEEGFAVVLARRQGAVAILVPGGPPGTVLGDPLSP